MGALGFARSLGIALGILVPMALPLSARGVEVVGAKTAHFMWQPASGPLVGYLVYVSRNGAPFGALPERFVRVPEAEVPGAPGDRVVVAVSAVGLTWPPGPLSPASPSVRFVTAPSPPAISISPSTLFLVATPGFPAPTGDLSVLNAGGGRLDFQLSSSAPWLQLIPSEGSSVNEEVPVHLQISTEGLVRGNNLALITVRAAGVPAPVYAFVSVTLEAPIPEFSFAQPRLLSTATLGAPAPDLTVVLTSSVPSSHYQIISDAKWIHPSRETGDVLSGRDEITLVFDPSDLPRGAYTASIYVVPEDRRALIPVTTVVLTLVDPAAKRRLGPDLDGDGSADLVWRSPTTGEVDLWLMNGGRKLASARYPGPLPAADWKVAAVGDLDGDGHADLVWQNQRTGAAYAWFMNGLLPLRLQAVPTPPGVGWRIVAADDFDADGRVDLVHHQADGGLLSIWLMNGAAHTGTLDPYLGGDPVASVVGSGDFDATGTADLVWRTAGGATLMWLTDGDTPGDSILLEGPVEPGWAIAAIADLDGNGKSDLVWRNETLRENQLWRFESPTVIDVGSLYPMRRPGWGLAQAGDFDGDGRSDLVWRNGSSSQATLWLMNGPNPLRILSLMAPSTARWEPQP